MKRKIKKYVKPIAKKLNTWLQIKKKNDLENKRQKRTTLRQEIFIA